MSDPRTPAAITAGVLVLSVVRRKPNKTSAAITIAAIVRRTRFPERFWSTSMADS
jgi:hypothetical protein